MQRLCIIGVGLIGGSLALALKQNAAGARITGCARNADNLKAAVQRGAIDDFSLDPATAVKGCDVVVLATPMGRMQPVLEQIAPSLQADAVVTDVGSAKAAVLQAAEQVFGKLPPGFVPGHPIAGHENGGIDAATADLYCGRRVILTPHHDTAEHALALVQRMWERCGAEVKQMDAELHDRILAATSHLPHVLAYALVRELANSPHHDDIFRYAAGGLRDFTRIAESDPLMWRDVCLANSQAIIDAIDRYCAELEQLREAIQSLNKDALLDVFSEAQDARAHFRRLLDARDRQS